MGHHNNVIKNVMPAFVLNHALQSFRQPLYKRPGVCHRKPRQQLQVLTLVARLPNSSLETDTQIDPASTDRLLEELETTKLPPSQAVIDDMVEHLGDSRGLARLELVDNFGRIGSAALPALLNALASSANPVVRRSCGKALAKIGDASATSALLHTLVHDDDTVTRSSAAGALARMGSSAVPSLLKLIADPTVNMTAKGHAAWAVAFMQGDAATALFDQLASDNKDVRIAVINALGAVAIGDALPTMSGTSVDDWAMNGDDASSEASTEDVRFRAVSSLRHALDDSSSEVRAEAATAIANAACVEEAPRIAQLLDDEDPETRRCAALSLMKLGDSSFIPTLLQKSTDEDEIDDVRKVAQLAATTLQRNAMAINEDDDWA